MAFENVQFQQGNFSIDVRDGSGFYSFDHINGRLLKKTSGGTTISSNFLNTTISEVQCLEYDGGYFWTLERIGEASLLIRKWEVGSDTLVRAVTTHSIVSDAVNKYASHSMAVEYYTDTINATMSAGSSTIIVVDGSVVVPGDRLFLGPSTAVGYVGITANTTVVSKVGTTLTVSPAVSPAFSPNDKIYFTRSLFVFSDRAPGDLDLGCLYKIDPVTGSLLTANTSDLFSLVTASTFFKGYVMFIRGGEVIWLNPASQRIFKSQAIDNLNVDRASHYGAEDLTGFSDTIYRLEDRKVTYNAGTDTYTNNSWSNYNYNTSSTVPEVYYIGLKVDPPILHHVVTGLTPQSRITVEVLDQFRTPVFNKLVQLTTTAGSLSPIQDTTDANGRISSTYTANGSIGQVTITAQAT